VTLRLVLIGLVAGLFSTLFGAQHGGTPGSPMSPLLARVRRPLRAVPGKARHRDSTYSIPAAGW
jgi:hypothetical protein